MRAYKQELLQFHRVQRNRFSEYIVGIKAAMDVDEAEHRQLLQAQEDFARIQQEEYAETAALEAELALLQRDHISPLHQPAAAVRRADHAARGQPAGRETRRRRSTCCPHCARAHKATDKLRARIEVELRGAIDHEKAESFVECQPFRRAMEAEQKQVATVKASITAVRGDKAALEKGHHRVLLRRVAQQWQGR